VADGEGDFANGPPAPLRLLTSTGKAVDYGDDLRAAVQVRLVERLNEFWSKHTVEGTMTATRRDGTTYTGPIIHRGFRRDFSLCDSPVRSTAGISAGASTAPVTHPTNKRAKQTASR
jgi:hypothetical protein